MSDIIYSKWMASRILWSKDAELHIWLQIMFHFLYRAYMRLWGLEQCILSTWWKCFDHFHFLKEAKEDVSSVSASVKSFFSMSTSSGYTVLFFCFAAVCRGFLMNVAQDKSKYWEQKVVAFESQSEPLNSRYMIIDGTSSSSWLQVGCLLRFFK